MVEQAEILKHDADPAPQAGQFPPVHLRRLPSEQADRAARRCVRHVHEPEQGRFAGPGAPGQEVERGRRQREGDVAEDLFAGAVAHADAVETDD